MESVVSEAPLIEVPAGRVTTLVINRPDKLNALISALSVIEADDRVRAVVLTYAGDRALGAGADIGDLAGSIAKGVVTALREIVSRGQRLRRRIETFPKPILVAVNGLAYGAGCEITEAAPLAVAARLAAVTRGINLPIDEDLAVEAVWFATMVPSQGVADGLNAFLNRRLGDG